MYEDYEPITHGFDPKSSVSTSKLIRRIDGGFTIELLRSLGSEDIKPLIGISQSLVESFGLKLLATKKDILNYFNPPVTHPFIARHEGTPIGFIIGVPLEQFANLDWAKNDQNLDKENTLYTYAYGVMPSYRGKGIAAELKSTYLWWSKDRGYDYITGTVRKGISADMDGEVTLLSSFENWNGTGLTFEYYRRKL